ncbi:SHIRT domain-containing protein [Peptococcus simiae]|uniref:SHIRT domain-containing protein n=1 Tax=Peptococcus simiae TaxID=1643805 RepID=A0ABW9GY40_9FIRM
MAEISKLSRAVIVIMVSLLLFVGMPSYVFAQTTTLDGPEEISNFNGTDASLTGAGPAWNQPANLGKSLTEVILNLPANGKSTRQSGYTATDISQQKYKVSYEFKSGTPGKELTSDFNKHKPTDNTAYADGTLVQAKSPLTASYQIENGIWTFRGWDAQEKTIAGRDITFIGTWTWRPAFTISKTVDKAHYSEVGEVLKYTVTVKNIGTTTITGLTLEDPLVSLKEGFFRLEPKAEKTFTYRYIVQQRDLDKKSIVNTATVKKTSSGIEKAATSSTATSTYLEYRVVYEFTSGTTGKGLPDAVEALLPIDNKTYVTGISVTAQNLSKSEVAVEDGKWTFEGWDKASKEVKDSNITFTGSWTFTPTLKYGVVYEFSSGTTDKPLPKTVTSLLPKDDSKYVSGASITAKEPSKTEVAVDDGKWTFDGWKESTKEVKDSNITFVGTWTFTPTPKYGVVYEFASGTTGKDLPDAVKALLPIDNKTYVTGTTVTAQNLSKSEVAVDDGKWAFDGWKESTKEVKDSNITFVGTWTFTPTPKYGVVYEFASGTTGKDLPDAVIQLLPIDANKYKNGTTVTAKEPIKTEVGVEDGKWTFDVWKESPKEVRDSDITFTGAWTFTPTPKYGVVYEFSSGTTDKPLPEAVTNLLPKDDGQYISGATVTAKDPRQTEVAVEDGKWTFAGWKESPQEVEDSNITFTGAWTFTPTPKYGVAYEFTSGTTGKDLPETVPQLLPKDDGQYISGATLTAKDPRQTEVSVEDGKWTFAGWKESPQEVKDSDITFTGSWTFTPTPKYGVAYEFTSATADKTLPAAVPQLLPKDDGQYISGATVTAKDPHQTEVVVEDGKWNFEGWDKASKEVKDGNITFTATWIFTPNPPATTDVTISKTVDKTHYSQVGEVLTYTVTVKNTGDKSLEALTLSDTLVTLSEGAFDLAAGKEKIFSYQYTIRQADIDRATVENTAILAYGDQSKKATATASYQPVDKPPVDTPSRGGTVIISSEAKRDLSNKEDHWAYMFGYPDGTFRPNRGMTRAEVTAMFARLLKTYPQVRVTYQLPYSDVTQDDWYYEAVGFMTENKMIVGYEDGTFRPNAFITRAEFVAMASRLGALLDRDGNNFTDVAGHWAIKSINSAAAHGWVAGYEDGSFKPDQYITRAEVVTVTNRMLNRYADQDFVRKHKAQGLDFKDLDESHWAYFNIMEATHGSGSAKQANGNWKTGSGSSPQAFNKITT